MNCEEVREVLSARMDGEDPGGTVHGAEGHLAACSGCRSWMAAAQELLRATRVTPAEAMPDHTEAILAAATARGLLSPDPGSSRFRWRVGLALVAVLQLVLAGPSLLFGEGAGAPVHVAHELGSWDVALAVGFLFAAWRPARAWGMLPLVTALVACLVVTTGVDLAEGHAELAREAVHALEVVGLGVLWGLARRPAAARRPVLRVA